MIEFEARGDGIYANGERFTVKGVSYFGMESDILVPHGLWGGAESTTMAQIAAQVTQLGVNLVRLPLAMHAVLANPVVDRYKMGNETELLAAFEGRDVHFLDVLDYTIQRLARGNLLVLLDIHVLVGGGAITPLWYDEAMGIAPDALARAWRLLATRYSNAWNVIGADLMNEPHGEAAWGTNSPRTDWHLCAQATAAAIHVISPRWLIFVEGIERWSDHVSAPPGSCPPSFWGGNLSAVSTTPLQLDLPSRLVYSPHVYGPSVADQPYFHAANYPSNLPSIWDAHFGFLTAAKPAAAPIVVGEWGGSYRDDRDRKWQDAFVGYLVAKHVGSIYWCVNPNSADTQGLMENDWKTVRADKAALLARLPGSPVPCDE